MVHDLAALDLDPGLELVHLAEAIGVAQALDVTFRERSGGGSS
jgi:hypothetical protein